MHGWYGKYLLTREQARSLMHMTCIPYVIDYVDVIEVSIEVSIVHRIQIIYLSHRCFWRGALAVFVSLVLGMVGIATSHEKCVLFFHCPLGDPNTVWGFLSKRTIITTITPNFKHLLLVVVVDDDVVVAVVVVVVVVVVVAIRMPLKYHNSFFSAQ